MEDSWQPWLHQEDAEEKEEKKENSQIPVNKKIIEREGLPEWYRRTLTESNKADISPLPV